MADNIRPPLRQAAAIALVAIGALAAAPWLVKITLGQRLIGRNPSGEVALACVPFAGIPVTAPIQTSISRRIRAHS